jgi:hypothetical protein
MGAEKQNIGHHKMSDPTPAQRAEYMIRQLENFIRDKRTEKGLSFKTWQALAHAELTNAFTDHERQLLRVKQDRLGRRILLVSVAAVVTIGFWGAVVTIDRHYGLLAAAIMTGAGVSLAFVLGELGARQMISQYRDRSRAKFFERIRDFDDQVKDLEKKMRLKLKKTKEEAEKLDIV